MTATCPCDRPFGCDTSDPLCDHYDESDDRFDPGEAARAGHMCQCGEFESCIGGCGAELDKDDDDEQQGDVDPHPLIDLSCACGRYSTCVYDCESDDQDEYDSPCCDDPDACEHCREDDDDDSSGDSL